MKELVGAWLPAQGANQWNGDSPMTDRVSLLPEASSGSAFTFAAFDAVGPYGAKTVTWNDWLQLLGVVAHQFISLNAQVVQGDALSIQRGQLGSWYQVQKRGDYALELSRILQWDNTYGARLVNCQDGTVLQYQPEVSSTNVTVWFSEISALSTAMPVMTDVPFEGGGFFMDVDHEALAAMDDYEREVEAKYQAACERDARAMYFDRG